MMVKRCVICQRRIWPWQGHGFHVLAGVGTRYWHSRCARRWLGFHR